MLNIAKQIYSGWNTTNTLAELPEAEIVPIGKTSNEKKRLETLSKRYSVIKEFDNIPLPGFTLYRTNRKNYGSSDSSWLIIDPRGFLSRIENSNLEMILHVTGITEGLIQEKCVWARQDAQTKMILVPVSSEKYIEAVQNTELLDDKVKTKDIQLGDKVLLQNKLVGTYLGPVSLYGQILDDYKTPNSVISKMLRRPVLEVAPLNYYHQGDLKILKVLESVGVPLTKDEVADRLNTAIASGATFTNVASFPVSYTPKSGVVCFASTVATTPEISFVEIDRVEAERLLLIGSSTTNQGLLCLVDATGKKYVIDMPYTPNAITPQSFNVAEIKNNLEDRSNQIMLREQKKYWNSSKKPTYALDNFAKFYKIVKHVKNDTYV